MERIPFPHICVLFRVSLHDITVCLRIKRKDVVCDWRCYRLQNGVIMLSTSLSWTASICVRRCHLVARCCISSMSDGDNCAAVGGAVILVSWLKRRAAAANRCRHGHVTVSSLRLTADADNDDKSYSSICAAWTRTASGHASGMIW